MKNRSKKSEEKAWKEFWDKMNKHQNLSDSLEPEIVKENGEIIHCFEIPPQEVRLIKAIRAFRKSEPSVEQIVIFTEVCLAAGDHFFS